ncbi:MAG: class I SAM-dependent methyltransferase [bacterium]
MNTIKKFIIMLAYRSRRFKEEMHKAISLYKSPFLRTYPPGHYSSPIPNIKKILKEEDVIFNKRVKVCPGVFLNEEAQLELLDKLAMYYDELPFSDQPDGVRRYYYENRFFSYADAIVLYAIMRHFKPTKIIEVGSGFSSAVMLDTNDLFLGSSLHLTFIEPFTERLNRLIREKDENHCIIVTRFVQEVQRELFDTLNAHDILFIDSSHVIKVGSDLACIVFEILPVLKPGVIIHFHDIFWPFQYPKEWFIEGRAWNEAYFIRAFLQFNNRFEVLYFNSFMGFHHSRILKNSMPLCLRNTGGSLWLRKIA